MQKNKKHISRRAPMLYESVKELSAILDQFVTFWESLGASAYKEERDAINRAEYLITAIEADEAIIDFKHA